jgi:hypothetical protein
MHRPLRLASFFIGPCLVEVVWAKDFLLATCCTEIR